MKRADKLKWSRLIVTREHILLEEDRLVKIINALGDGPLVRWDHERGGWGLFAEKNYASGTCPENRVFFFWPGVLTT